jgi:molybdopterin-guanine dinucleotide biosynthesis protein A
VATEAAQPFAVVILAGRAGAGDADRVAEMVVIAREVGAHAIVVAVPRGWRAPAHARVVHVAPGSAPIAAVRAAMAQLSNTPARYAVLWPLDAWAVSADRLRTLVAAVQRERPPLAAIEGDDPDHAPVMIAREAWLDLMTLGEQGIEAVGTRCGLRRVVPDRAT